MVKINCLLSKTVTQLLRFYRYFISPMLGNRCRFYPSCSEYAQEAIEQFGTWKGSWMTLRRLSCCHPFHPGGYDPVTTRPEK
jgi:putative membrane protein insertion efficiency factor